MVQANIHNLAHVLAKSVHDPVVSIGHDAMVARRKNLGIHVLERDLVQRDCILIRPELSQQGNNPEFPRRHKVGFPRIPRLARLQIVVQPVPERRLSRDFVLVRARMILRLTKDFPEDGPIMIGLVLAQGLLTRSIKYHIRVGRDERSLTGLSQRHDRVSRVDAVNPGGSEIEGDLLTLWSTKEVVAGIKSSAQTIPSLENGDLHRGGMFG